MPYVLISAAVAISAIIAWLAMAPSSTPTPTPTPTPAPIEQPLPTPAEPTPAQPTSQNPTTTPATKQQYMDGTYSADGSYGSPAGPETIGVTLSVQNDIVTNVSIEVHATNRTSRQMQEAFATGVKQYVVGKPLAILSVGVVSGSSLTGEGFNAAVEAIKLQAVQK